MIKTCLGSAFQATSQITGAEPETKCGNSCIYLTILVGKLHHASLSFPFCQPIRKESSVHLLTSGNWDVTSILAYDEGSERL